MLDLWRGCLPCVTWPFRRQQVCRWTRRLLPLLLQLCTCTLSYSVSIIGQPVYRGSHLISIKNHMWMRMPTILHVSWLVHLAPVLSRLDRYLRHLIHAIIAPWADYMGTRLMRWITFQIVGWQHPHLILCRRKSSYGLPTWPCKAQKYSSPGPMECLWWPLSWSISGFALFCHPVDFVVLSVMMFSSVHRTFWMSHHFSPSIVVPLSL